MNSFRIKVESPNPKLDQSVWHKLNQKTKPIGSLGRLEHLAHQIARVHGTLNPQLKKPVVLVFAGDHGIAKSGLVNPYPQEVTQQMVMNFLSGGAAINIMSKTVGMEVVIVDAGVNHEFESKLPLIHAKVAFGTEDYRSTPAMSEKMCVEALQKGTEIVEDIAKKGSNVIGFGEMGIGNTSSAALIISTICGIPIEECVGAGTGAVGDLWTQKLRTLQEVQQFHRLSSRDSVQEILATYGGFEIAGMVGGMLEAASKNCIILVDGFISTAAYLIAYRMEPAIKDFAVFTHQSEEAGHIKVLKYLDAHPLLKLQMRLGEGTGCAACYPLLEMAVSIINDMASFESAGVSGKAD
ncbi:MAG: nicotinate-nucleotide--dimethylbenzimidazole phosphoribosyltransferase [Bacteroidota bacterium]